MSKYVLKIVFPLLFISMSASAEGPSEICKMKVEKAAKAILAIEGFANVLSCRDTGLDICLSVTKEESLSYHVQYAYGSSAYPAYVRFEVKVDDVCQLGLIDITHE